MITIDRLTKRFGRTTAVNNLSLRVEPGQSVALWGDNGAGKTTVIRCTLGVLRFRGRITVGGSDVRRRGKPARRLIGYVPQELAFNDDLRVHEALAFFAGLRRVPPARALACVERVGLAGHLAKRTRQLSGGMKQRLALALAILDDPPLVVLDEPTSNLDASARAEVVHTLADFKRAGRTILFASHRFEEVETLADRVCVMSAGRLQMDLTPAELAASAPQRSTLRLLVDLVSLDAAVQTLRDKGLSAQRNGHGLLVEIERREKAVPIQLLTRANIAVHDFEVLTESSGGNGMRKGTP